MAAAGKKQAPQYKRSWKNLLLNKRYQLRFTLFMVGMSAILMSGLGIWVMKEANEATTVAMIRVRGEACPKVPEVVEVPSSDELPAVPMNIEEGANAPVPPPDDQADKPPEPSKVDPAQVGNAQSDVIAVKALWCTDAECTPELATPLTVKANKCDDYIKEKLASGECVDALKKAKIPVVKCEGGETFSVADAEPAPRRATVQLEESSMTITPTLPTDFADRIVSHHLCEMRQASALDVLEDGRRRILLVLLGTGILLMFGLGVYGIKMTHKVAGPLHKVTLYLAKMRDGRYDKVYDLRKGDQLVEFYEHFKHAHAGVVALEKDDIARIKAALDALEADGVLARSADARAAADGLRKVLERKEASFV